MTALMAPGLPETHSDSRYWKDLALAGAITILIGAVSYWLHIEGETTLRGPENVWEWRVNHALEYYPFNRRYFTTYTMLALHHWLGLGYLQGYLLLQATLFLMLGLCFFRFLRVVGFTKIHSLIGLSMLLLSYPILCAHFEPLHHWDDFWQYLFSLVAMTMAVRGRLVWAAVFMTVALIAREAAVLLYPAYALCLVGHSARIRPALVGALVAPILTTSAYLAFTFDTSELIRAHCFLTNFRDAEWARHTFYSLLVSFGALWLFGLLGLISTGRSLLESRHFIFIAAGGMFLVPLTVLAVLTTALARETRLFFPPFIFVIPLSLLCLSQAYPAIRRFYRCCWGIPGALWAVGSMALGVWLAFYMFPTFDYRSWPMFSTAYLGVHFGLALVVLGPIAMNLVSHAAGKDSLWCHQDLPKPNNKAAPEERGGCWLE